MDFLIEFKPEENWQKVKKVKFPRIVNCRNILFANCSSVRNTRDCWENTREGFEPRAESEKKREKKKEKLSFMRNAELKIPTK